MIPEKNTQKKPINFRLEAAWSCRFWLKSLYRSCVLSAQHVETLGVERPGPSGRKTTSNVWSCIFLWTTVSDMLGMGKKFWYLGLDVWDFCLWGWPKNDKLKHNLSKTTHPPSLTHPLTTTISPNSLAGGPSGAIQRSESWWSGGYGCCHPSRCAERWR